MTHGQRFVSSCVSALALCPQCPHKAVCGRSFTFTTIHTLARTFCTSQKRRKRRPSALIFSSFAFSQLMQTFYGRREDSRTGLDGEVERSCLPCRRHCVQNVAHFDAFGRHQIRRDHPTHLPYRHGGTATENGTIPGGDCREDETFARRKGVCFHKS